LGIVVAMERAPVAMSLGAQWHGGADALGVPAHDFSTNANACGPCPAALAAVTAADASHYPDPTYDALRQTLAAFHAVDASRIALAASASEFIARFTAWVAREGGQRVWLPRHAYGDYARSAAAWRLARVADPSRADLAWLCEPSSPLGAAEPAAQAVMASGTNHVVLDLAYEPLRLSGRSSFGAQVFERAWQLWTPNKALGLTGVRAAYAIAPVDAMDAVSALDTLAASWPIGAHGVALLKTWPTPPVQHWLSDSLRTLRDWKALQIELCQSLGWTVLPGDASYLVARVAPQDIAHLPRLRLEHGVKLRDTTLFGLPGHVRLGVRPPADQAALHAAWTHVARGDNATARVTTLTAHDNNIATPRS
jgi:histidinol-phosphate aminotransferase